MKIFIYFYRIFCIPQSKWQKLLPANFSHYLKECENMKKIILLSIVLCGLSFSAFSSEFISSVEKNEILSASSSELQTISFVLEKPSLVTLEIFDLQGKLIKIVKRNESMDSGKHTIHIDTASLKKGSYFRKLSIDGKLTKVEIIENK